MQSVGLNRGAVLYQPVENMYRLPDAARNKGGEQSDIAVSDGMICNTAIAPISDVLSAQKVVFSQWNVRAVRDRSVAGTPKPRQGKAVIGIDQISRCGFQLGCINMLSIDAAKSLGGGDGLCRKFFSKLKVCLSLAVVMLRTLQRP